MILPAFSHFNIYSSVAKVTTSLGPLCVATAVSKLEHWDAEVIDENNCASRFCPKDGSGRPDHEALQRMRPADVVGFYGSLSSTVPRIFELAQLYRGLGVRTVTGGKHVENLPEESIENGLDAVVIGEGERTIQQLLLAWQEGTPLEEVRGIAFSRGGAVVNEARPLLTDLDVLPYPDFGLLRYVRIKIYPVGRIRGCNMNCEFCAVKDRTRCASPEWELGQIANLVETRGARKFFDVSDHFASGRDSAMEFCRLLADYRRRSGTPIGMTVQTRISDAEDTELLAAMREAGIYNLAVGFESPIDEELKIMRKGYLSRDMIRWTETLHRYGFFVHGMFIFGYPKKDSNSFSIDLRERRRRFRRFIKEAKIDTAQVVLPVPLPGTDLRTRLEETGRLYSREQLGWEYYDGQFPLFEPDDGVTPEELQRSVTQIMGRFYRASHLLKMLVNMVIHFPRMVILASLSIITFRVRYVVQAFLKWKKRYFRNEFVRFGGYLVFKIWLKKFREDKFLSYLRKARVQLAQTRSQLRRTGRRVGSSRRREGRQAGTR